LFKKSNIEIVKSVPTSSSLQKSFIVGKAIVKNCWQ